MSVKSAYVYNNGMADTNTFHWVFSYLFPLTNKELFNRTKKKEQTLNLKTFFTLQNKLMWAICCCEFI